MVAKSKRVTLNQVIDDEAHVEVDFNGAIVNVWYQPSKMTRRMSEDQDAAALEQGIEEDDTWWIVADVIERIVTRWDLYENDEAEEPLPITKEAMKDIPAGVIYKIRQEIQRHYIPKYVTGMITPAGSEQTESSEVSPNGTTT